MANPHVHYPEVQVDLVGAEGNTFAIIAAVCMALRRFGASSEDVATFRKEAMVAEYAMLMSTVRSWVS